MKQANVTQLLDFQTQTIMLVILHQLHLLQTVIVLDVGVLMVLDTIRVEEIPIFLLLADHARILAGKCSVIDKDKATITVALFYFGIGLNCPVFGSRYALLPLASV